MIWDEFREDAKYLPIPVVCYILIFLIGTVGWVVSNSIVIAIIAACFLGFPIGSAASLLMIQLYEDEDS